MMRSVYELRAALEQFLPESLYEVPPDSATAGDEEAVKLWSPVEDERLDTRLDAVEPEDDVFDLDEGGSLDEVFEVGAQVDAERVTKAIGGAIEDSIRQAIHVQGVDALGWYVPFHATGAQRGIYIRVTSLLFLSTTYFGSLNASFDVRLRLALRAIHQHELFHFATEVMACRLELIRGESLHREREGLKDPKLGYIVEEEKLANAWMLRSFRRIPRGLRVAGALDALRQFVAHQPPGYRDAPELEPFSRFIDECRRLACHHLRNTENGDPHLVDAMDAEVLFPIFPSIDWRHCPVHLIHDEHRLNLPPIPIDLFRDVPDIEETKGFQKSLSGLDPTLQQAWVDARSALAQSTDSRKLNFKFWERRKDGSRIYSVRLPKGHRAHLRYVESERRWYAVDVGSHKEMGHD